MIKAKIQFFFISICLLGYAGLSAQPAQKLLAQVASYDSGDYDDLRETFTLVQHPTGLLFMAASTGIISFDGQRWKTTSLPNHNAVYALAIRGDTLWVGGSNELGYAMADRTGNLHYHSLIEQLPEADRQVGIVRDVYPTAHGHYFRTKTHLLRWDGQRFRVWLPKEAFDRSFWLRDTLYIQHRNEDLMKMVSDSLVVAGDESFWGKRIFSMLPYRGDTLLVAARHQGLFKWTGDALIPWQTASDELLRSASVYRGITLPDGSYAFGTYGAGLVRMDRSGHLMDVVDRDAGLQGEIIRDMFVDQAQGIWVALHTGVARIGLMAPIRWLAEGKDTPKGLEIITRHEGRWFRAGSGGLYMLDSETFEVGQKIEEVTRAVTRLKSWGKDLLIGSNNGLFAMREGKVRLIAPANRPILTKDQRDTTLCWMATDRHLFALRQTENGISTSPLLYEAPARILHMAQTPKGDWLLAPTAGLFLLKQTSNPATGFPAILSVDLLDSTHHASPGRYILKSALGQVWALPALTDRWDLQKLWRFDAESHQLVKDSAIQQLSGFHDEALTLWDKNESGTRLLLESYHPPSEAWTYSLAALGPGQQWQVTRGLFNPVDIDIINTAAIWIDTPNDACWMGRLDGRIAKIDLAFSNHLPEKTPPILEVLGPKDSLMHFSGLSSLQSSLVLPFAQNRVLFQFSLPQYENPAAHLYQWKLAGFDQEWSAWTQETNKEYAYLPAGRYVFRLRAMNSKYEQMPEMTATIEVLPPWYATVWAWVVYLLGGVGLMVFGVRWRTRQLQREKEKLEQIITERTHEIAAQAEKLKEMDQVKSRFFANISHEFRTPLTLIIGPANRLLRRLLPGETQAPSERELAEEMGHIQQNAHHLLGLVNQLLDLSKLETGSLKLALKDGDIHAFLRGVAAAFTSYAEYKDIDYQVHISDEPRWLRYDPDRLATMIQNLLGNAFKFTPEGGWVQFEVHSIEPSNVEGGRHSNLELRTCLSPYPTRVLVSLNRTFRIFLSDFFRRTHLDIRGVG